MVEERGSDGEALPGDRRGGGGGYEIFVDVGEITLTDEFLGEEISDLLNFAVQRRTIYARAGENDKAGKCTWCRSICCLKEAQ